MKYIVSSTKNNEWNHVVMRKAVGILASCKSQSNGRDEGTITAVRQTPYKQTIEYNKTLNKIELRKTWNLC